MLWTKVKSSQSEAGWSTRPLLLCVPALLLEAVPTVKNRIPWFFPAAVGALTRKAPVNPIMRNG